MVGLAKELPIEGVDDLLGKDVRGGVIVTPLLDEEPLPHYPAGKNEAVFPDCCTQWPEVENQGSEETRMRNVRVDNGCSGGNGDFWSVFYKEAASQEPYA
ncbi:hypothetical protein E2C01_039193 [Portunus trituberculatus]|uniref:Uncharacterized protein n=1 Tax=Portunus trituberculatus TaxID=210409 RepID=A0A5B7FM39_PORTR|nr:hypothetical protein [Portunus trituberculatus]